MKNKINIIPINDIDKNILNFLKSSLEDIFSTKVYILDKLDISQNTFNESRKQYDAVKILNYLTAKLKIENLQEIYLAVFDQDLFTPSLNFVFGIATGCPKISLISTARLNPFFYVYDIPHTKEKNKINLTKKLSDKDEKIFKERILKEAVHEIGHTLLLNHCPNYRCVMYFSNSLIDTDRKSYNFCSNCLKILSTNN